MVCKKLFICKNVLFILSNIRQDHEIKKIKKRKNRGLFGNIVEHHGSNLNDYSA